MSKTTFLGYVPSLKSKHEATIVGHKAIQSKGGSIRYTLQGEYQGRKTLPKTVSKADFESVYGFDAKEAEAVIIHGKKRMHPSVKTPLRTVVAHKIGVEDKDGFIPTYIDAGDFKDGITLSEGLFENHADTVLGLNEGCGFSVWEGSRAVFISPRWMPRNTEAMLVPRLGNLNAELDMWDILAPIFRRTLSETGNSIPSWASNEAFRVEPIGVAW